MPVRLRMIFKYTEIVCRKTHDVSANVYMDSQLNGSLPAALPGPSNPWYCRKIYGPRIFPHE